MYSRLDAELLAHAAGVAHGVVPPVDLHHAIAAHALREVLVRRPDADLLHVVVGRGDPRRRRQRVVGLELDHGPDGDAHVHERLLQRNELGAQRGIHAGPGLVAGPEVVAEGLDHVIGRDADVRRAALDQLQHGVQHPRGGAESLAVLPASAAATVEVAEQLIGAVDEVNDHRRPRMADRAARRGKGFAAAADTFSDATSCLPAPLDLRPQRLVRDTRRRRSLGDSAGARPHARHRRLCATSIAARRTLRACS